MVRLTLCGEPGLRRERFESSRGFKRAADVFREFGKQSMGGKLDKPGVSGHMSASGGFHFSALLRRIATRQGGFRKIGMLRHARHFTLLREGHRQREIPAPRRK